MTQKTNPGRFFEDFAVGETLAHATPRTLTNGDRALYQALYPTRFALYSSEPFAQGCGLPHAPIEDLAVFHVAFGKTVPDVSLNAVANLGYAEMRTHRPAYVGDTLTTTSEVIGLKQNSSGATGVVWVRSTATNQRGELVMQWVRWVMVRKRDASAPAPEAVLPELAPAVAARDLILPARFTYAAYDAALAGEPHRAKDYAVGERIDHVDGATLTDAEHMMATRLWQNTAKVHFNTQARDDGRRLIYGGHIISMARALSFNGLANAQMIAAINAGAHANPAFAGDTVYAASEILDIAETDTSSVAAIRIRLVATKDAPLGDRDPKSADSKYLPDVLLDLDYWALMPA